MTRTEAKALCRPSMSVDDARRVVEFIREQVEVNDDEVAHAVEDKLREAVLEAIATGPVLELDDSTYVELARLALSTRGIEFSRWCA